MQSPVKNSPRISTLTYGNSLIKHAGAASIGFEALNTVNLKEGDILIAVNEPTHVKTGKYLSLLKPGAIALVSYKGGILKIRNMYENNCDSIRVMSTVKQTAECSIGHEVVLSPNTKTLKATLQGDALGRRRVKLVDLQDGNSLSSSEISMPSLMQQTPLLLHIFQSKDENDQALFKKMSKMAVGLSIVTSGHGPFSTLKP